MDSVGNVYLEQETEEGVKHEYLLDVSALDSRGTLNIMSDENSH